MTCAGSGRARPQLTFHALTPNTGVRVSEVFVRPGTPRFPRGACERGQRMSSVIRFLVGFAICSLAGWGCAQSPPAPAPLRVIAFDGGWNLPLWAAQRQGYFEAQGIAVALSYTPNSAFLVTSVLD